MRALLGLPFVFVVGCSNACPPPVLCTEPHPDYCPCTVPDAGSTPRPDAFVPVDAFVEPTDDAGATDAGADANADSGAIDSGAIDSGADANADAG